MRNVGILTIHAVYNYGAMLQAYALQKYISDNYECVVDIIDYRPYSIYKAYDIYWVDIVRDPRRFFRSLKRLIFSNGKFDGFIDFDNAFLKKSTIRYSNAKELFSISYDLVISGSDQIWNPLITNFDKSFLLPFESVGHKSAFSSSIGLTNFQDSWGDLLISSLKEFDVIAVREKSAFEYINGKSNYDNLYNVLDPVFLLDCGSWLELSSDQLTPSEEYLLIYSLEINDEIQFAAQKIAEQYGLRIVAIHPFQITSDWVDIPITNAGPREFLSLINNAQYVVTNSFHGVSFSIIFGKKLISFPHSTTGSRIVDLIDGLELLPVNENELSVYYTSSVSSILDESVRFSKSILNKVLD
jgi:hypothetical protein